MNIDPKVESLPIPNQAIIGIAFIGVCTSKKPNIFIKAKLGSLSTPNQAIIGIAFIGASTPVLYMTLPNPPARDGYF